MIDIANLNDAQRKAVETTNGPLMILAGAGSGKTKTLVTKIGYLLENHKISPYKILALTFSNKAAKEMRERIGALIGIESQVLQVTTFHSFCARLLRHEANYLGLTKNFTIYDDSESKQIAKALLERRGISTKQVNPYDILNFIDGIKNKGFYDGHPGIDAETKSDPYFTYFQEFESELRKNNALDFGSLITATLQLFHTFPDVLKRYQERYDYMLVDEYQDTNKAQFELITLISGIKRNICVVGDEDQSIYSWRGADINNILQFESVFQEAQILKLEQNYRSSSTIIEAASAIIEKNTMRKGKVMWTENPSGDAIEIVETASDKDEVDEVVRKIEGLVRAGVSPTEIAIFYRANSLSRLIEDALRRSNIQYKIIGGLKFYDRKEIKDALAYIRIIVNPKDSLALTRIINVPTRGVGATTLRKLEEEAIRRNISLSEAIELMLTTPGEFSHIRISTKVVSSLSQFSSLMHECKLMNERKVEPHEIFEKLLLESGYLDFYKSSKDFESQARVENLEELINAIRNYEETVPDANLEGFLESVTLDESSLEIEGEEGRLKGDVSLMTIHGAKGLEFEYVFLIGIEENIFPSIKSLGAGDNALEEERRLFYVGMTRAMKKLYISFAQTRMTFGQYHFNGPSRFVYEIPEKFYQWHRLASSKTQHHGNSESEYQFDQSAQDFEKTYKVQSEAANVKVKLNFTYPEGAKIRHQLYGKGTVLLCEGFGSDEKVTIKFEDGAKKKFMVKFAPLSRLDT